jgi:ABC-2 type transport system permease protein
VPARVTFRAVRWGAYIWGYVFGALVFSSAATYQTTYSTLVARKTLATTLGTNPGLRTLFGPARAIDTTAGFTAWRCLGFVMILGGIWGVLAATRALRGEEDVGRWDLVLTGPTSRRGATASGLVGLARALIALWAITAVCCLAAASRAHVSVASALFFAVVLVSTAAVFLAVGAVTSQLASSRRQAAMLGGGAFGLAYLLRMVADSSAGAGWLRWFTPLGWIFESRPLTEDRVVMLVPVIVLVGVLVAVAVALAGRRDAGAGVLPERSRRAAAPRRIYSPLSLAGHLTIPGAIGWTLAAGVGAFVFGLVAKAAADATRNTPGVTERLARIGVPGMSVSGYVGATFVFLGLVVALVAAAQVASAREQEVSGTLDHFLSQPVSRTRWLSGRLAVALGELLLVGVVIGAAGWLGTATQVGGPPFVDTVVAGLNLVPVAVAVLGIGILFFGVAPRIAAPAAYAAVAWSFLAELVASVANAPSWLLDLSLTHHVAPAPAVDPHWGAALALVAVGAVAGVLGLIAFRRRDIVPA